MLFSLSWVKVEVLLGAHSLTASDGEQVLVDAAQAIIHPNYVRWEEGYDIALVKLSQEVMR